ncbi:hypothetical protein LWI29_018888 [Acer saccharum]|uniref:DUF4283 domain-containing protein n=1 Tax=Acer saccharum TaxID=4024 RepID=A0AA39T4X4_ACESA|nr:hypothetical protein LWI29_018888 [Acer saccharum]
MFRSSGTVSEQKSKTVSMSWMGDTENEVEDWLSRSAIGKLKEFSSLIQVNKNLEDRGINFSSSYMGGKNVVWTFESCYDRVGFINNGFLWRNCFASMIEWKESWSNSTKLKWIDIYGVPLICWCKDFFKKVGGLVGETMWIEEETLNKKRLDKGRILILAPFDKTIPSEILVKAGHGAFPIRLEESSMPVSSEWLSQTLYAILVDL